MSNAKHRQGKADHLEAAAHLPRGPYEAHQSIKTLVLSQQAHALLGARLYALTHLAHPVRHVGLPQTDTPQA
jgi:hypothetical protein